MGFKRKHTMDIPSKLTDVYLRTEALKTNTTTTKCLRMLSRISSTRKLFTLLVHLYRRLHDLYVRRSDILVDSMVHSKASRLKTCPYTMVVISQCRCSSCTLLKRQIDLKEQNLYLVVFQIECIYRQIQRIEQKMQHRSIF